MLWTPSFLGELGSRAPVTATMPTIGSTVFGVDTSQRSTFFSDTGGATQAADSATVGRINDAFAAASINFQCDDSASRPQLIPSVVNGRAALRFAPAGNPKFMYASGGSNNGGLFQGKSFTIALTYRRASALDYAGIFSAGNGNGGNGGQGYDFIMVEGAPSPQGQARLIRAGGGDLAITRLTSPTYADNQVTKYVARCDPTNGTEVRSRSASGSFSGTGALPTSADLFVWDWAVLGAELGYNGQSLPLYGFVGDIFEFRFWGQRATDAQFDQMQNYLDLKYGS